MASAVKHKRTQRKTSCFSRAARMIRGSLSRVCRGNSPSPPSSPKEYAAVHLKGGKMIDINGPSARTRSSRHIHFVHGLSTSSSGDSDYYYNDDFAGMYYTRKKCGELSGSQYSINDICRPLQQVFLNKTDFLNRKGTDAGYSIYPLSYDSYDLNFPTSSLSFTTPVADPPYPQCTPTVLEDSTVYTEAGRVHDGFEFSSKKAHSYLQTLSSDPGLRKRHSSCLPCSHSVPTFSQIPSAKNKNFTRAESLPDMLLKDSFEEFTPDITVDENEETYMFHCTRPGLYQCSVTGLVFHMEGEGDVVYIIVPWNHRLLAQHHKKPAGPLFDIKCLQKSVCQLHLPHCEIRSTSGCEFLSVAHVNDEGIEFITPHKITETHVIINITGFSGFGNVNNEDSPHPVRALVLLFYTPPTDPDPESVLNVLLLPKNVVLRDVLRMRKKFVGDERYIEISPHCKLLPKQEYTLSTSPEDDSVLVQPAKAEFDEESYDNYFPSFQVTLEKVMKSIKLFLSDTNSCHSFWERRVCLYSTGVRKPCGSSALTLPSNERLKDIRSDFIDGISGPVLKSLLDKMFGKNVITEYERESADEMQNKRDKARFVIDTVRKKGEAASSEMIEFLCEVDPFLCEHLGLI